MLQSNLGASNDPFSKMKGEVKLIGERACFTKTLSERDRIVKKPVEVSECNWREKVLSTLES